MNDLVDILAYLGLREPASVVGSLISDPLRYWQTQNSIKFGVKLKKLCDAHGVDPKCIPKSFLFPIIEIVQNQDDESLQNVWANLLKNAASGEPVHPSYINVLKDLSSIEVNILNAIYEHCQKYVPLTNDGGYQIDKPIYIEISDDIFEKISKETSLNINKTSARRNISRLALISFISLKDTKKSVVHFEPYGVDFIKACRDDRVNYSKNNS